MALVLKGQGGTWYPTAVTHLNRHLAQLFQPIRGVSNRRCWAITKNLSYTLQYLEFTARIISDIPLSSVLLAQTIKSFVIHGCAVVEAIFFYVLVKAGKHAQTDWVSTTKSNSQFTLNGKVYRVEMQYLEKLAEPSFTEMTFDAMCKKVETNHLVKLPNEFYKSLPYLRALRNRIHLHALETYEDSDYNKFSLKDLELMKKILRALLTSELFPQPRIHANLGFLDHEA
jgi:hypothetical protein